MIKEIFLKNFTKIHIFIFGKRPSKKMKKFGENVGFSFFGGILAFALLFFANILAARILGPEEYGKYSVFFSIAQILALFYVLELDVSAIFFLAKKGSRKKEITSSVVSIFLINIFTFTLLMIVGFRFFEVDNVSEGVLWGIIVMGLSIAIKRMVDGFLRGFGKFKEQIPLRILEGGIVLFCVIIALIFVKSTNYSSYALSVISGGLMFSIIGFIVLSKQISLGCGKAKRMNEIFRYNVYGLINATVNASVKHFDKIIVVLLLGTAATGVYAAYFTASVVIGARVTQTIINVFFPVVRKNKKSIKNILAKLNKIFIKVFFPLIFVATLGVAFIVFLFGAQYEFNFTWIVLGGFYISVHLFSSLYGMLLSSMSKEGYRQYNLSYVYGLIFYMAVIFTAYVTQSVTITTFLIAMITYRLVSGLYTFWILQDEI